MICNLVNENFKSNYLENLLMSRGIENVADYLNPTSKYLQDPRDLKNIEIGAVLFNRIVFNNTAPYSNILIIVDADVDGFTSAAIMYQYIKIVNPNCRVDYWLHEGKAHGLSDHIDRLMSTGTQYDLLILPDSSSNDKSYHDILNDIHLPCLVIDHHITDTKLSDNAIVINNQLSPNYKNKALTGSGMAYQFCRYIDRQHNTNYAEQFVDLAAWGIIADMGSVLELENRYLICTGLKNITNKLMRALLEKQAYSITGKMGATWEDIQAATNPISIAFYLAPMVNALIRVGTMEEKDLLFKAFIDGDQLVPCNKRGAKGTMEKASVEVARVATNARTHQNKIVDEAEAKADLRIQKYDMLGNKILIFLLDDTDKFPPEINGLLAMRLCAKYGRPTLVLREGSDGFDKGSARAPGNTELKSFKDFLTNSGYFEYAQGHAFAFGASISNTNIDTFQNYANDALKDINFSENVYDVNFERSYNDTDINELIKSLCSAGGIWGQGNPEALIHIKNSVITSKDITLMGANKDTLKITLNGIPYIKFKAKDLIDEIHQYGDNFKIDLICKPNLNEYMGRVTPQMFIEDYEVSDYSIIDF